MRNQDPYIYWDYSGFSAKIRDGIEGWEEWLPIPWWGNKERMNNQVTDSYLQAQGSWLISRLCYFFNLCNLPEPQPHLLRERHMVCLRTQVLELVCNSQFYFGQAN